MKKLILSDYYAFGSKKGVKIVKNEQKMTKNDQKITKINKNRPVLNENERFFTLFFTAEVAESGEIASVD